MGNVRGGSLRSGGIDGARGEGRGGVDVYFGEGDAVGLRRKKEGVGSDTGFIRSVREFICCNVQVSS